MASLAKMTVTNSRHHQKAQLAVLLLLILGSTILFRFGPCAATFDRNAAYVGLTRYIQLPVGDDRGSEHLVQYFGSVADYRALGALRFWRGRHLEASQYFSVALQEEPSDSISGYFLAASTYEMGDRESALSQWVQIGASATAMRYISDARTAVVQSDVTYRLALAEIAVRRLAPSSPDMYAELAEVYDFHGDYRGAVESYRRAVTLENNPSRLSGLLIYLGRALRRNNQQQDALAAFQQAVALMPSDPNTHLQLADQYTYMGLYVEAWPSFERALRGDPHNPHVLITIANFYKMQGHYREAEAWYRRAIDADPSLGFGEYNLGRLALEEGKPQEAIVYLEQAIRLGWDSYPVWLDLGCAHREAGDLNEATATFRHVVEMPNVPPQSLIVAWTNLAIAYTSRDEFQLARTAWDNVLGIDPNNQAALNALRELP
jgi:tetratricopeptide (TPR) repeat protein